MGWLDGAGVAYEELEYTYQGRTYINIEVEIPGDDLADEIYIAGAHYDAHPPGADDNASGTAGLAEIARAMAECTYRRTIRLVFFSNEEVGTVGSREYAADASDRGDDIQAYLNLDMIGYGPDGKELEAYTRPGQEWLINAVVSASEAYADQPAVAIVDDACG
jgi:Zn-dependent M28 family amino/carboxypeptidase